MNRRRLLVAAASGSLGKAGAALPALQSVGMERRISPFGVQSFSYAARLGQTRELRDPLAFLRFCRERGAGGVQMVLPVLAEPRRVELRRTLDETGMWLEASVRLPRDEADLERFSTEVRAAREAGAAVVRTVMLSGRRYETFGTAEEYRQFKETSARAVSRAARVVEREQVRLAVENHKDYRTDELVALMRGVGSEWVGVTVDTGNNLALLEEPLVTMAALAPFAMAVHLKDMAVEECAEGFRLAEVPFGRGCLDLPRVVAMLRKHRPEVRFSIEMATRDPLTVPCLTDQYWATFEGLPGKVLARMLAFVRERREGRPLPRIADLAPSEKLRLEDENVRSCLAYASRQLERI